jgi:predicted amidohydrolase
VRSSRLVRKSSPVWLRRGEDTEETALPKRSNPTVEVVQFHARLGEVKSNVDSAVELIESAAGRIDLVVFPELFSTGYHLTEIDHRKLAEPIPGGVTATTLASAAARSGCAVCAGLIERDGSDIYDTAVVIGRNGQILGRYRKSHLHPSELSVFGQGDELLVVPLDGGVRLGIAICFEHAFPEIFSELALAGANLIAIPSAVPDGFGYLIELRTRARAQDNQVFIAAANLVGDDGQTKWCGRSGIVNPRGEVVAFAGEEEAHIEAVIDFSLIESERRQEPVFHHRRPELYPRLRSLGKNLSLPGDASGQRRP